MNKKNSLSGLIKYAPRVALLGVLLGGMTIVNGVYGGELVVGVPSVRVIVPAPPVEVFVPAPAVSVIVPGPDFYLFGGDYDRRRDAHDYSHRGYESRRRAHHEGWEGGERRR